MIRTAEAAAATSPPTRRPELPGDFEERAHAYHARHTRSIGAIYQQPNNLRVSKRDRVVTLSNSYREVGCYSYRVGAKGTLRFSPLD